MTSLKDLKAALEGFDETLDVKIKLRPIHPGESVDGFECGDFEVKQETFISVTYYYPLSEKPEPKNAIQKDRQNQQRPFRR